MDKKKKIRFKSFTNTFNNRLLKIDKTYCNSNYSSISKKTGAFEENITNLPGGKVNSFSTKRSPNNLCFSIRNNIAIHSSADLSINDLKEKGDINNICTNINISIDNPNFSINNIENLNKASSKNETNIINNNIKNISSRDIRNPNLISFKGSNIESESQETKNKIILSLYADYLENKSNSKIFSDNKEYEPKLKILNDYLDKNKILQYEYNKGIISGFSAYTYQNEEIVNKDKFSININIEKKYNNSNNKHLINFFSLFCGDKKNEDDDLTKFLKNNFKDILLEEKEIVSNPINAIKNSFAKCELKYINYYLKEKNQKQNTDNNSDINNNISKIPICSIIIILTIDNIFYIGNIGNLITIISSNLSKKIEYLSKENITQEEYESRIKKKRNSLHYFFNHNNINYINEIDTSKDCFNSSKLNNIQKDSKDLLNIINLNTIYTYNFIRIFPGKKLNDILSKNNNKNQNKSNNKIITSSPPLNNINKNEVKINNFIKNNEKKQSK